MHEAIVYFVDLSVVRSLSYDRCLGWLVQIQYLMIFFFNRSDDYSINYFRCFCSLRSSRLQACGNSKLLPSSWSIEKLSFAIHVGLGCYCHLLMQSKWWLQYMCRDSDASAQCARVDPSVWKFPTVAFLLIDSQIFTIYYLQRRLMNQQNKSTISYRRISAGCR